MASSKLVLFFALLAVLALVSVSDAQYYYGSYGYPAYGSYYGYGSYPSYYDSYGNVLYGKRAAGFAPHQ